MGGSPMSITRSALTWLSIVPAGIFVADASANEPKFGFGREATPSEIAEAELDVRFDGAGLPPGSGTPADGAKLYQAKCAACHGTHLEGTEPVEAERSSGEAQVYVYGVRPLVSEAHYGINKRPFAPPLFAYIRRAMPLTEPGSLSNDEVYAIVAFLLTEAGIIASPEEELDAAGLRAIEMPNRSNYVPVEGSGVELSPDR